ncbi:MAG: DUF998 domain-containing protein [Firmicutes bacterium]|nr:DUF998 domain-containing protein [Bacillota bacterium]
MKHRWAQALSAAGPLAIASAWATILWAIREYPGYHLLGHSLSDLGGPLSPDPAVYNVGLMVTGGLISLYGVALLLASRDPAASAGATVFSLDGVFLGLIGYFHEGTAPHVFLSMWFFIEAALGCFLWGIGQRRRLLWSFFYQCWAVATLAVGLGLTFPSTAYREIFGVAAIDVFGLATFFQMRISQRRHPAQPTRASSL